jgi:predicted dehydrogenase
MEDKKKIVVVGLGSMGKRRVRNLQAIGDFEITGFDLREDRREEAKSLYKINVISDLTQKLFSDSIYAMIISVPPHLHHIYMKIAADNNIPAFVEASVVDNNMDEIITEFESSNTLCAPSGTLYFHPAIKQIYSIVQEGRLGKITNVTYHSGQYLPDWHTYEKVSEYYVSNKETGGAREIVPFELTWLTKLFGFPNYVSGVVKKTIEIEGAEEIDDTYNALLEYPSFILNLVVDVVSRSATRRLLINGSEGQLFWDWNENKIKIYSSVDNSWKEMPYEVLSSASGYNKNITEQMYIDEVLNFLSAIEGKEPFFNDLSYDHKVLKLLYTIEESSKSKKYLMYI